jgi:hypothetical protein
MTSRFETAPGMGEQLEDVITAQAARWIGAAEIYVSELSEEVQPFYQNVLNTVERVARVDLVVQLELARLQGVEDARETEGFALGTGIQLAIMSRKLETRKRSLMQAYGVELAEPDTTV